jgi:hypothetical protein
MSVKIYKYNSELYHSVLDELREWPEVGDILVSGNNTISDHITQTDADSLLQMEYHHSVYNGGCQLIRKLPRNEEGKTILIDWFSWGINMCSVPGIKLTDTLLGNITQPIELTDPIINDFEYPKKIVCTQNCPVAERDKVYVLNKEKGGYWEDSTGGFSFDTYKQYKSKFRVKI